MKSMDRLSPGLRRMPSLAALLFVVIVLLIFNLSNLALYRRFEQSKEGDLAERLMLASRTIARDFAAQGPPLTLRWTAGQPVEEQRRLLSEVGGTASHTDLVTRLGEMARFFELNQAVLMTTQGVVLADTKAGSYGGFVFQFVELDRPAFEQAVAGRAAQSPMYYLDSNPYKRAYAPLRDEDGSVLGVVMGSVSPAYVAEIRELRRRVVTQGLISSGLLLVVGYSIFRLFRRAVRAERGAMQSARIEAMGALAAGLAHELRNPLAITRALAEEVATDGAPESRAAQNAKEIVGEVERLNELVTRFLSLSRPPELSELRPVDLATELRRVVRLVVKSAPADCHIAPDYPAAPVMVRADETALTQLLLNLLLNAVEALPGGKGTVRVSLRATRDEAEIVISDTGRGIARRNLERIFEPFHTTKPTGTGLGLAISRGIVEALSGSIEISSEEKKGTEARVRLPVWAGADK